MRKLKLAFIITAIVLMATMLILVAPIFFNTYDQNCLLVSEINDNYADAVANTSDGFDVIELEYQSPLRDFEFGKNVALYDTQGILFSNEYENYDFIPHLTQTVVIAVNRSLTDEKIESFADLLTTDLHINFDFGKMVAPNMWEYDKTHQIVISMANAIYGEFDIDSIAKNFKDINEEGRFFTDDMSKPIIVTHDSTVVEFLKEGKNLEIIIPSDGTLSFDFGAVVYNDNIKFDTGLDEELLKYGYRLLDGRSDLNYYPPTEEYLKARHIVDIDEYNLIATSVAKTLRRKSFDTRKFGFTNSIELTTFFLFLLLVVICYYPAVLRRITEKKVRSTVATILVLLMFFLTIGLMKSVNYNNSFLETMLWYFYYIPILFIPALFVKIAIQSCEKFPRPKIKKIYRVYFGLTFLLLLLILTNNLHNFVFIVEDYYNSYFTYNIGYYFVAVWVVISVIIAYSILMYNSITSPRKWTLAYPILLSIIVGTYVVALVSRFTPVREFDVSFAITMLILLCIESCMQSNLLPTNKGYSKFFLHSNLAMKIKDNSGKTIYKSLVTKNVDDKFIKKNTDIVGGKFSYFEDYTVLIAAEKKMSEINSRIKTNNELLLQRNKVGADIVALNAEKLVYRSIDSILLEGTEKIEQLIDEIKKGKNKKRILNIISIHAAVMKRECMYRINALYQDAQPISILINSLIELKEYTENINLSITIRCTLADSMSISNMSTMYSFFIDAVENAIDVGCENIIVQIYKEDGVVFSVLADKPIFLGGSLESLKANFVNISLTSKKWEDTEIYLLNMPYDIKNYSKLS